MNKRKPIKAKEIALDVLLLTQKNTSPLLRRHHYGFSIFRRQQAERNRLRGEKVDAIMQESLQ